ncbi:hypothetical protein GALMADRAFT_251979 [Galerina marginata CBS 339.88]|uniref:FAD-binding PCMH-type domain-containing protein n=1 Tax=Galerina marginata (strain CBS 339.88) TaxID=685588 RepID=A0A067SQY5_GALM3|nr:hypothetical protein GALMADRAFT_251979 [Galerina marginata CBS 339.88]
MVSVHRPCPVVLQVLSTYAAITSVACASLIADLRGQNLTVLAPGDSGYANASAPVNLRFAFQPAAITFPYTTLDVSEILKITSSHNHQAVARSGGHSYIANGLGGKSGAVVVDMSNFNTVTVDQTTNIAVIGTGNRLGEVALALNDKGRAIPHGVCPYVGIGGHSGHGGFGFTARKWGLLLDNIRAMEVVLSNGKVITASNSNHPDLFWALRGASSSFGIVTAIHVDTFAAPPSTTVFQYAWDLDPSSAASAIAAFQFFVQSPFLPQEFGAEIVLAPGSSPGRLSFGIHGGWYAPPDEFPAVIAPLLSNLPPPVSANLTVGTYINSVEFLGGLGTLNTTAPDMQAAFYAKSLMTPEAAPMSNASLNALANYLATQGFMTSNFWFIEIELYGGVNSAINKVPLDATSFGHRSSMFTIQFFTISLNASFPAEGFTLLDGMVDAIVSNNPADWDYGAYMNYIDDRLNNWQRLYFGPHYPKLKVLKALNDPQNTFRFPLSIEE